MLEKAYEVFCKRFMETPTEQEFIDAIQEVVKAGNTLEETWQYCDEEDIPEDELFEDIQDWVDIVSDMPNVTAYLKNLKEEEETPFNYKKFLLDKRWKIKRITILKRDNYQCKGCSGLNTLTVHHNQYTEKFPWNEPDENLITLCKKCHSKIHKTRNK